MDKYGGAGKSYINWCAQMAVAQNVGVPWIMCQQADAPAPMINTCNGYYCDEFTPNNPNNPKVWTENWIGWFKTWGSADPHRTAEDSAFSVARFFQSGGILNNYYMYHGGTNFGRTGGGPYITASYDYDAPINEYGNLNQPKWGHLKELHQALKAGEGVLTNSGPGPATTKDIGNGVQLTTYIHKSSGERFCFLSNTNTTQDANVDLQADGNYSVPAWSVSILQNCSKEIYNTAKINSTLMVKQNYSNLNSSIHWSWLPIPVKVQARNARKRLLTSEGLLDQKAVTVDASDYLWYLTTVNIDNLTAWKSATIRVYTSGHVLHAFVNNQLVGTQWGTGGKYDFQFEKPVPNLKRGSNYIALLSATVGFQNYGAKFDLTLTGLANGSVELIGQGDAKLNLTNNEWAYKVGVFSEGNGPKSHQAELGKWRNGALPIGAPLTLYSGSFEPPNGTDPVVVDLNGMGKGEAWVNGNSIGRYWPAFKAEGNCSSTCDYRGSYSADKCLTNCGNPTQRYYHVPRSFFLERNNTLVLFEEIRGDPSGVSFHTVH